MNKNELNELANLVKNMNSEIMKMEEEIHKVNTKFEQIIKCVEKKKSETQEQKFDNMKNEPCDTNLNKGLKKYIYGSFAFLAASVVISTAMYFAAKNIETSEDSFDSDNDVNDHLSLDSKISCTKMEDSIVIN